MTAIIGYANGNHVFMGGDSRANRGWDIITRPTRKVFRVGEFLIGGSGAQKSIDCLRLRLVESEIVFGDTDESTICISLADAIERCWDKLGIKVGEETDGYKTSLMVGFRGVLYYSDPYLSFVAPTEQIFALGSGGDLAHGALVAMLEQSNHDDITDMMIRALDIAGRFNASVSPPYYVEMA